MQEVYSPPVSRGAFGGLALLLTAAGLVVMAFFFTYEMSASKQSRSLSKELPLALSSSILLGFGLLFGALWAGLYV
jgi:hypothetical protein